MVKKYAKKSIALLLVLLSLLSVFSNLVLAATPINSALIKMVGIVAIIYNFGIVHKMLGPM